MRVVTCLLAAGLLAGAALACEPPSQIEEASPATVSTAVKSGGRTVLTFVGYSVAGYEDRVAMLAVAERVPDEFDPAKTIVSIGATADGIGAV